MHSFTAIAQVFIIVDSGGGGGGGSGGVIYLFDTNYNIIIP